MPSEQVYAAGTAAALAVEKQIIQDKGVPSFMVPSDDVLQQYAAQVAKAVIDAADAASAQDEAPSEAPAAEAPPPSDPAPKPPEG
jgi:hypothetical protein